MINNKAKISQDSICLRLVYKLQTGFFAREKRTDCAKDIFPGI
jgi:hypothetical protein